MNDDVIHLLNKQLPYVMHIDLNSCFAIIEQQANRLLRGKPVGIAAYDTPRGFVIAASYEAKAKGVKLGVNVEQSRALAPGIIILTPDPAKYREAHKRFKELLLEYTPDVVPKSIDEFVLDMRGSPALRERLAGGMSHNEAMRDIGMSMKAKIRERLGEWVTVNVGIGTNRFLAKYAAGFGKPDGMTLIDHTNLRSSYENMKLVDLPGINVRYRARLRLAEIYTPLDFLAADLSVLRKQVFKSVVGYYWYLRLRGHEIDKVEFGRRSIGHQYALSDKTTDMEKLERLLLKLCEKTGRRLRKNNLYALGIHLYLGFVSDYPMWDGPASFENMASISSWHHGQKVGHRLYSTSDIYEAAKKLLYQAEIPNRVKIMSVHVFELRDWDPEQLSIFDIEKKEIGNKKYRVTTVATDIRSVGARKRVSDAVDAINNRYGEFVLTPAAMMDMSGEILDRIAFGQVKDM
jgi:DNA polymerase-4